MRWRNTQAQLLLVGNKSDLSEAKPAEAAATAAGVERVRDKCVCFPMFIVLFGTD